MKTIIKLKYLCRWCHEPFESSSEFLDNFRMIDRLHQMHYCNITLHKKQPDIIQLRCGIGDLVGYNIIEGTADDITATNPPTVSGNKPRKTFGILGGD